MDKPEIYEFATMMQGGTPAFDHESLPQFTSKEGATALAVLAGVAGVVTLNVKGIDPFPVPQAQAENGQEFVDLNIACVSPTQVEARLTLHDFTPNDLPHYKFGLGSAASLDQNGEPVELPADQRVPLADLLSSSRSASDGITTPPYNNDPLYNGDTTIIRSIAAGSREVTVYSYQDFDPATPDTVDKYSTVSKAVDCSAQFPGSTGAGNGGGNQTPPPAPICKFDATVTAASKARLPKNGKGVLSVGVNLSPDTTAAISGEGRGDSPKAKIRNKAAHIEVKFAKPAKVSGKLPHGMLALKNGEPLKKGQTPNMVSIDIPNRGVSPDHAFNAKLKFQLLKRAGAFVVSLKGLPGNVDFSTPGCNLVNVASAKVLSKTR